MELNSLKKMSSKKNNKRIARGNAGKGGTTGGRGTKGYLSRSGSSIRPGFRGGTTPIYLQIPKLRGSKSLLFKKPSFQVVNLEDLERVQSEVIDFQSLFTAGLVTKKTLPVKILSVGDYKGKAKEVIVNAISKLAQEKLEKAGVKVTLLKKETKDKTKGDK